MTGSADGGADPGVRSGWRWDVALSFAGAQRGYVEQVAAALKAQGVRCFYDADEQIELWGTYLAEELSAIYAERAATVVVFVSADYAARDWTRLERRAALDRAVRERREYVLPARFDDTSLPGLLSGMVAVDLRRREPEQFAAMVVAKLATLNITVLAPPADVADHARAVEPARPAGAMRVDEVDPRWLGVHAAISVPGVADDVPPAYVERDVDNADNGVRAQVAAAAARGGFVLLVGSSSVGKTRSAYEAVRARVPQWWLVHPAGPDEVAALAARPPAQTVVWLDELQRYLDGPRGLSGGVVRKLLNASVLIVGTLWPDRYAVYTAVPTPGGDDPHAREREVLGLAGVVRIASKFSAAEQDRACTAATGDRRLQVALDAAGYGLTQTLAAAPQLVAHWDDADPYARAVLSFYHGRMEAAAMGLEPAADQLAQAVRKQWEDEAALRRLNDPYPLPVAWRAADTELVEPWELLAKVARAWPGGPPGDPARWPAQAAGLAGADAQIGEVFAQRVPTRRLVVLGEPGAGKTMLLIRLLQDLIEQRPQGGPVPVLFSLASWDPTQQPLQDWLAGQLRRGYPGLRAPAPAAASGGAPGGDLAQALLDGRRILPLLDGFDELPPALHALALDALNQALPAKQPLVLAGRAAAYRDVVLRPEAPVRLNGAAGIQLLPLDPDQAAAYLRRAAGGPHAPAADRWHAVLAQLGTASPVGQALSTPLDLFLARTIYNPRPRLSAALSPVPHPQELCDPGAFPTRTALDTHLFKEFIPAAYTPHQPQPPRWPAAQAQRTFVFLARHLETNRGGSPDLAWWELPYALSASVRRLTVGLAYGLAAGLVTGLGFGLEYGLLIGLLNGLAYGLAAGLGVGLLAGLTYGRTSAPGARPRWSPNSLGAGLTVGLTVGLAVGLAVGLGAGLAHGLAHGLGAGLAHGLAFGLGAGLTVGLVAGRTSAPGARPRWSSNSLGVGVGLAFGLGAGLTVGLAYGLAYGLAGGLGVGLGVGLTAGLTAGLTTEKPDLTAMVGPAALLTQDRRTFLAFGLGGGLAGGLAGGLGGGLAGGLAGGLGDGLALGLTVGFGVGFAETAWGGWVVARGYLALRRKVPRDLMTFLQDAHERRGVLRQVGTVYQFRHLDLQRHLAQQPWPPAT